MATCTICNIEHKGEMSLCRNCGVMLQRLPRAPVFLCLSCGGKRGVTIGGATGRCLVCGNRGLLRKIVAKAKRAPDREEPPVRRRRPSVTKKKPKVVKKKPEPKKKSVWEWIRNPAL